MDGFYGATNVFVVVLVELDWIMYELDVDLLVGFGTV